MLGILDRVSVESLTLARHLVADNTDIERTLRAISEVVTPHVGATSIDDALAGGLTRPANLDAHHSADVLAAANRRLLCDALVRAIEVLDLPADAEASAPIQDADRQVRALIVRMLGREVDARPPVPSRVDVKSGGGAVVDTPERVATALRSFLIEQMPSAESIEVTNVQRMAGGASREAWLFDAAWSAPDGQHAEKCVMLRHPVSSVLENDESETKLTGTRRLAHIEFKLIRLMEEQGIPVAHMLWVDADGKWLDRPFSISRFLAGTADVSGLIGSTQVDSILDQYVEILGRLHTVDPVCAGVDFLGAPTTASAAIEQVELFEAAYNRQRLEQLPAINYMIRWLKKHHRWRVVSASSTVTSGSGNFMHEDGRIVAMLDWEHAHLGDPLEEIAFMYWPLWSLESIVPLTEFIARYEAATGITVDPDALAYYRVFIELKMCVVALTGINSYFATQERQLRYGGPTTIELLVAAQQRVMAALDAGGPTIDFGHAPP